MSNLVLVPAKKHQFNPYKVVEWLGYALAAAFVIWCMWFIAVNGQTHPDLLPWYWLPVGMIGGGAWVAVVVGGVVALGYVGWGVGMGYTWLRKKGREYGEVSD